MCHAALAVSSHCQLQLFISTNIFIDEAALSYQGNNVCEFNVWGWLDWAHAYIIQNEEIVLPAERNIPSTLHENRIAGFMFCTKIVQMHSLRVFLLQGPAAHLESI